MKKIAILLLASLTAGLSAQTAGEILDRVDKNLSAENRVMESSMTIHGKRRSRTMTLKTYTVGDKKSFSEYLSPARERGTKMLKLEDKLWIYSPSTDRTIQISGHMLRQSVMGSDFSYEDMMDDRKLQDIYSATVAGEEEIDGRKVFVLELTAIVEDVAYHSRQIWIDKQLFVPVKEELFAKSGELLKKTTLSDIQKVQGKWFPMKMTYKDMLKHGSGTEIHLTSIKFNQDIPAYIFTKAALKK